MISQSFEDRNKATALFCRCFACRRFYTGRCTKGAVQCSFHKVL